MTIQSDLENAVSQVQQDAEKLHNIIHGPSEGESSTVLTNNGLVKTIARAIADLESLYLSTQILEQTIDAKNMAQLWASADEDLEVLSGLFSARHYAEKAKNAATILEENLPPYDTDKISDQAITQDKIAPNSINITAIQSNALLALSAHKNRLINGRFLVRQRGTNFENANGYTIDRWFTRRVSGADGLHVQSVGNIEDRYISLQREVDDTQSEAIEIKQSIETNYLSHHLFAQEVPVTFSVDISAGNNWSGGNLKFEIHQDPNMNSGPLDSYETVTEIADISPVGGFTRYHGTTNLLPTTRSVMVRIFSENFSGTAQANDHIRLRRAQLEISPTPTPLEHEDVALTILRCQRYYQVLPYNFLVRRDAATTGNIIGRNSIVFSDMRTTPTAHLTNINNLNLESADWIILGNRTAYISMISNGSGSNGSASGVLHLDAEL